MDNKSLSHTRWKCQYHIVFIPKYRKKVLYGKVREDVREIISTLCKYKSVEIIAGAVCIDHVHLSVAIPPKFSVSDFMGQLKGKSSMMIFDRFANLKYRYGNRKFWCRGCYVDTVGRNNKVIEEYIKNQLQEDKEYEQLTMDEMIDLFTGESNKKANKKSPCQGQPESVARKADLRALQRGR